MAELIVNDLKRYTVDPLYQWDIDQQLVIYGLNILEPEIHFTNEAMTRAIVKQPRVDNSGVITVDVPNTLLQKPYSINVYVCGYEDATFKTYYKVVVPVKARTKPGDYTFVDTDNEIYSYNALEKMVTDATVNLEKQYTNFTTLTNTNYSNFTNEVNNRVGKVEDQMNELNDLVSGKTSLGDADTLDGHDSTYFATKESVDDLSNEVAEAKKSCSEGKQLLADTLAEKDVIVASDATFEEFATSIENMSTSGEYVWARYTIADNVKGEFVDYITDKSSGKYPTSGVSGEYWYEIYRYSVIEESVINEHWSQNSLPNTPRGEAGINAVDNNIYFFGGAASSSYQKINECYDTKRKTWTTKADMPGAKGDGSSEVVNDLIYYIGGRTSPTGTTSVVTSNYCYNPSSNTWASKKSMTTARSDMAIGVVANKIYCVGGQASSYARTENECYNPSSNTWSTKKETPTSRYLQEGGVINDLIYVVGGNGSNQDVNECYNPSSNTWSTKASMPTGNNNFAVAVLNNILHCLGGKSDMFTTHIGYDPITNTWNTYLELPTKYSYFRATVVGNVIYCMNIQQNISLNPTTTEYTVEFMQDGVSHTIQGIEI